MTMKRYLNPNWGVGGLIPGCEIFSLLDGKNQEPTHCKIGSKPHPAPRVSLSRVGPTGSNSRRIARRCIIPHWDKLVKNVLVSHIMSLFSRSNWSKDIERSNCPTKNMHAIMLLRVFWSWKVTIERGLNQVEEVQPRPTWAGRTNLYTGSLEARV